MSWAARLAFPAVVIGAVAWYYYSHRNAADEQTVAGKEAAPHAEPDPAFREEMGPLMACGADCRAQVRTAALTLAQQSAKCSPRGASTLEISEGLWLGAIDCAGGSTVNVIVRWFVVEANQDATGDYWKADILTPDLAGLVFQSGDWRDLPPDNSGYEPPDNPTQWGNREIFRFAIF